MYRTVVYRFDYNLVKKNNKYIVLIIYYNAILLNIIVTSIRPHKKPISFNRILKSQLNSHFLTNTQEESHST